MPRGRTGLRVEALIAGGEVPRCAQFGHDSSVEPDLVHAGGKVGEGLEICLDGGLRKEKGVRAGTAVQGVLACATFKRVIACVALQRINPGAATQDIVAVPTAQYVVAREAVNRVVPGTSG